MTAPKRYTGAIVVSDRGVTTFDAYLALGSNLGDRAACLERALNALNRISGITVRRVASIYESEAHTLPGTGAQPAFLNTVVQVGTRLQPEELLDATLEVERRSGRLRSPGTRWEPRTIDIDVLTVDDVRLDSERLTLPHRRISERRFVLEPLAEIAPDLMVPPPYSKTIYDLLRECSDATALRRVGTFGRRGGRYTAEISDDPGQ